MRHFTTIAIATLALAFTATSVHARGFGGVQPNPAPIDAFCFESPYDPTDPTQAIECCMHDFPGFAYCDDVIYDALQTAGRTGDPTAGLTYARLARAKVDGSVNIEATVQSIFWGACVVGSSLGWIAGGGAVDEADEQALENCENYESD